MIRHYNEWEMFGRVAVTLLNGSNDAQNERVQVLQQKFLQIVESQTAAYVNQLQNAVQMNMIVEWQPK